MDKKYIIKNCPAIYEYGKGLCCNDLKFDEHTLCQNCTDCVMKQIVDKCKTVIDDDVCLNCNKFERGLDCYECDYDGHREDICMNRSYISLAKNLLSKLDIQEAE